MPLDEFALINRYFSSSGRGEAVDLAVGDDCAILRLATGERLATSVDTLVAGVHFPSGTAPDDVGYRAVAAAASDLAAMGARPLGMTLALVLPAADETWLAAFARGVAQAAEDHALPLVGGDTTRGPLTITVQVLGALPRERALLRRGARPGDCIYVSGNLGDAAAALAVLAGDWQPAAEHSTGLLRHFNRPQARLALGRALLGRATAAIDISDGLLADAGHIATASGVRLRIDADRVPLSAALASHPDPRQARRWALTGGDDYELCFCLPAGVAAPDGCTCIGVVEPGAGVDCGGEELPATGYRHF